MRFAERFLVAFAAIAMVMRYAGMRDGPTMELIALPLLAVFYALAIPLFLFRRRKLLAIIGGIVAGAGFAYCIVSLMLHTLGWLPRLDMLENCCVILILMIGGCLISIRRQHEEDTRQLLWRSVILLSVILIVSFIPLPALERQ